MCVRHAVRVSQLRDRSRNLGLSPRQREGWLEDRTIVTRQVQSRTRRAVVESEGKYAAA